MPVDVSMPKLGMTMTEGTLKRWLKIEGQEVQKGTPVLEIETEKIVYEIEAMASGFLHITQQEGATVPCGSACGVIATSREEYQSLAGQTPISVKGGGLRVEGGGQVPLNPQPSTLNPSNSTLHPADRISSSPAARRLARELNVNMTDVRGTGPGGRILEDDVRKAAVSKAVEPALTGQTIPLSGRQKIIADHMVRSLQTSAQLTLITDVDATALAELHHQLMAEAKRIGARITHGDLLAGAVIRALKTFPIFNSTIIGDEIKVFEDVNLGIATPDDDGLIVPVVHNANRLTLVELSRALAGLAEKAQNQTLSFDDVTGGTFTISNLSAFDVMAFTPIVNSPECAILGVGGLADRPAVVRGQLAIRSTMYLCLTWDHRVADGVPAAKFLRAIKQILERPSVLLV